MHIPYKKMVNWIEWASDCCASKESFSYIMVSINYISMRWLWYSPFTKPSHLVAFLLKIQMDRWLNKLGSWITQQLIQAYHQYGVGSCPRLCKLQKRVHSTCSHKW